MDSKYNKILDKLKNKKVIIYGAGKFFCSLDFDFSRLNIVGISDKKFLFEEKGDSFRGMPIIPYRLLNHNDADYILLALENPKGAYNDLKTFIPKQKLISFVKIPRTNKFTKFFNRFKKKNNVFVLVKQDGTRVHNPKIKNLTVKMYGENNYIEIHEPLIVYKKALISCYSNSRVIIGAYNRYQEAEMLVGANNELIIGKNAYTVNTSILLRDGENNKITIGDNCIFSYNVIIRTEDAHTIYDCKTKEIINKTQDIKINNHVWVAPYVTILKGSNIPSNCIVGTYTLVNKKFEKENCVIAGFPAKVVRQGVNWDEQNNIQFSRLKLQNRTP